MIISNNIRYIKYNIISICWNILKTHYNYSKLRISFENSFWEFKSMILWNLNIYFFSFLKTTIYEKDFYGKNWISIWVRDKKFEKAPEFENDIERNYYFTLPTLIHKQTVNFINDESFIILTLMFGYFKVTNKFFELNSFSPIDTKFISDKYQLSTFDSNVTFTSRTIQRYKQLIKTHLGINEYNNDIESKLQQYAIELANNFTHRKKIFFS